MTTSDPGAAFRELAKAVQNTDFEARLAGPRSRHSVPARQPE